MNFVSQSQAGQDVFCNHVIPVNNGMFVDIGCGHPIEKNNTYALEQIGWSGFLIDGNSDVEALCRELRVSPMAHADARSYDWSWQSKIYLCVDYASVDVDEHTNAALVNLLSFPWSFRVLTIEHDAYLRGDRLRVPNRELMKSRGYDLLCADVHDNGCCFEDWYVHPLLVDMTLAEPFRSSGLDWKEVLKKGGSL